MSAKISSMISVLMEGSECGKTLQPHSMRQVMRSNPKLLSCLTKCLKEVRCELAGCNVNESGCSLVNAKGEKGDSLFYGGSQYCQTQVREVSDNFFGVPGATRRERNQRELGRPYQTLFGVKEESHLSIRRHRNDRGVWRESDEPIVAEMIRTTEPYLAKGLDFSGVNFCSKGREIDE